MQLLDVRPTRDGRRSPHAAGRSGPARNLHAAWAACSVVSALLLSACGGGGGDTPPATPPSATASAPVGAASSPAGGAAPTTLSADTTCALPDFVATVLKAVNDARAQGRTCGSQTFIAAAPLNWNDRLFAAAAGHSTDMAQKNYFSHSGADGSAFDTRLSAAGYAYSVAGENIAAGYADVAAVMQGWLSSPGHCANLMNAQYKDIGVSCAKGVPGVSSYGTYWTMDLAAPR
ncbi:MAG: CAP domain-containing protein [Betaproteobacteria bacterium]|nr:CAP domain-containing protein [Betaproteobacteria bacterium]